MKKTTRKDFFMEIKKSPGRFLSIFFIVAMGVAFFSGIRSSEPDMRITADAYFDGANLMDIKTVSTLGITEEDLEAFGNIKGISKVVGGYSGDFLQEVKDEKKVLHVMSLTEGMNEPTVTSGRLPEKAGECLVDDESDFKVGDEIHLSSGTGDAVTDSLTTDTLKVVGTGNSPCYISFSRGSTTIGTGSISAFALVIEDTFDLDVYTEAYLQVKGAKKLTAYTSQYEDRVDEAMDRVEKVAEERGKIRRQDLVDEATEKLQTAKDQLSDAKAQLAAAKAQMELAQTMGLSTDAYTNANTDAAAAAAAATGTGMSLDMDLSEMETKIQEAEKEIDEIPEAKSYVYDRSTLPEYSGYGENADRMRAIGRVFPVIFFLVAALISLTSMTRMVEEQRMAIGTMKALGYGKMTIAKKYIGYALLATVGGSIFGFLIGEKILPYIIIYAYEILYHHLPKILVPYNWYYAFMASGISIVCITAATFFACYKELMAQPAVLMRPPSPKIGKRVLLERVGIVWNHLNFSWKSSVRNLMRYKKRFFMTIFGIGGCMALMLVGFGLKDSIFEITQLQYKEIQVYDGAAYLKDDVTEEEKESLHEDLKKDSDIAGYMDTRMKTVTLVNGKKERETVECVLKDQDKLSDYVHFRDRKTGETYKLDDSGVILTEKTAHLLDAQVGDTIEIKDEDRGNIKVKISAICENYMGHYIYMTPSYYEKVHGEAPEYNSVLYSTPDGYSISDMKKVGEKIIDEDAVLSISYIFDIQEQLDDMLKSLNLVIVVLIISAGMLAFVVLYNLNTINITERQRELATLKVLGFYDPEVAAYVYRENMVLTLLGAVAGCILGKVLHLFIIETVEVDSVMFGRVINLSSFLYALAFTIAFSLCINGLMYFKLKKIDMVESLKSVE